MTEPTDLDIGLSYDDVLLVPQHSTVTSRSNVDTSSKVTPNIAVPIPIISSNMDTVTESEMAQAMYDSGGVGIIHRFMTPQEQADEIATVDGIVGASVGVNESYVENIEMYLEAGAGFICIDIAHGHLQSCIDAVKEIRSNFPDVELIAGNVATGEAAVDLVQAGADTIKVGIGGGAVCRTREVTGVGVPQFTAVRNVANALQSRNDVCIIADGGIETSGDIVKALMAGADTVMVGSFVADTKAAPGETVKEDGELYKEYRGMASSKARDERTDISEDDTTASEGAIAKKKITNTVSEILTDAQSGIQSGLSYCGGRSIQEARENASFMRVTNSTINRNGVHNIDKMEGI